MATKYLHPYDRSQVDTFIRHYRNQHGLGGISVYRGSRLQSGAGLGNILASIGRFLLPIIAPVAKTFIGATMSGTSKGKSIKEAAKEALKPTLSSALSATSKQIGRRMANKQQGSGRRRRRTRKGKGSKHRTKSRQLVYKRLIGRGRKRKASSKRSKSSRRSHKRVRYLNPSFANF